VWKIAANFLFQVIRNVDYYAGKELEQLALLGGFSDAKFYEIAGGLMGILVAKC